MCPLDPKELSFLPDTYQGTFVHFCERGMAIVVGAMLEEPKVMIWSVERGLEAAVQKGQVAVVKMLLGRYRFKVNSTRDRLGKLVYYPELSIYSALQCAAREGMVDMVRLLLDKGTDSARDNMLWRALEEAAANGRVDAARVLLEHMEKLDIPIYAGKAVVQAVEGGHTGVLRLLLDRCLPHFNWLKEALAKAIDKGDVELASQVLATMDKDGLSKLSLGDCDFSGGLRRALKQGHLDMVRLLFEAIPCYCYCFKRALYDACGAGQMAVVRCLLVEAKWRPFTCTAARRIQRAWRRRKLRELVELQEA